MKAFTVATAVLLPLSACALRDIKPGPVDPSGLRTAQFVLACPIETTFLDAPDYLMIYDWYKSSADPDCRANSIMVKKGYSLIDVTEGGVRHRRAPMYYNRDVGDYVWDVGLPKAELNEQRYKANQIAPQRIAGTADDHVGVIHSAYRPLMVYEWTVDRRTAPGKIHSGSILFHGATDTARMIAGLPTDVRRRLLDGADERFLARVISEPKNSVTTFARLRLLLEAAKVSTRASEIVTATLRTPTGATLTRAASPSDIAAITDANLRAALSALRLERLADSAAVREALVDFDRLSPSVRSFVLETLRNLPDFHIPTVTITNAAEAEAWGRMLGASKEYRHVLRIWANWPYLKSTSDERDIPIEMDGIGRLALIRGPQSHHSETIEATRRQLHLLGLQGPSNTK